MTSGQIIEPAPPDWTGRLVASGNLRRRAAISRLVVLVASGSALIAVVMLAIVVFGVVSHGASQLSFGFVFNNQVGLAGGGIANLLIGSAVIVAFGALIAVPLGILSGLFLTEFAGPRSRSGRTLTLALDLMQGLPSIVVALFIYALIVLPTHQQSGFAASLALAIIMLPLVARASQEVLLLVPGSLREAADALGVNRWRTVLTVILPAAMGGIATGAILAIARAAGETAPLLVLNTIFAPDATVLNPVGHGVPSAPLGILTVSDLANPDAYARGWGTAFVLLTVILLANIGARVLLARSRRKQIG